MIDIDLKQELIDNDRYFFETSAKEDELNEVIGECAFCGADILKNDTDYIINDKKRLGICAVCLDKCHWG